jgi:hypothetical protein
MKNGIQNKEEYDEYIESNELFEQMLELYTMLPPFPFRKTQKKPKSDKESLEKRSPQNKINLQ